MQHGRAVGSNGGQVAAFTYDLAKSVIYTRQGNPAWSGQERDGILPIRSDDLFFGAAAGDSRPDWVDLNKVAIPQADEQQRLLANIIDVDPATVRIGDKVKIVFDEVSDTLTVPRAVPA